MSVTTRETAGLAQPLHSKAPIQLLVNLPLFLRTAISHVWGPARKQIAFEGFTKLYSAL